MRRCFALLIVTFLVALSAPLVANAFVAWDKNENVQWQGAGYYVLSYWVVTMGMNADNSTDVAAGPFSNKADCMAVASAHNSPGENKYDGDYSCEYVPTLRAFRAIPGYLNSL